MYLHFFSNTVSSVDVFTETNAFQRSGETQKSMYSDKILVVITTHCSMFVQHDIFAWVFENEAAKQLITLLFIFSRLLISWRRTRFDVRVRLKNQCTAITPCYNHHTLQYFRATWHLCLSIWKRSSLSIVEYQKSWNIYVLFTSESAFVLLALY